MPRTPSQPIPEAPRRRPCQRLVAVVVMLAAVSCKPSSALRDLSGREVDVLAIAAPARVLVFVSSECPISSQYAPELQRLVNALSKQGARFWLVYPSQRDSVAKIRAHLAEYDYGMSALRDPEHALVRYVNAEVTPSVAVLRADDSVAYAGRIDDRYVALGKARAAATRHDLEDAVRAVLAGRTPTPARTAAVGCTIAQ